MELLQLTYFCDAAESENFTKTAARFNVPPSNISQTIHRLEKELGIKLFDRRANKAILNEAGRTFYKNVKSALMSIDEGKKQLNDQKGVVSGEIKLLVLTNRNTVTKAIEKFRQKYPQTVFTVSHRVDENTNSFDVIVSDEVPDSREYNKKTLITEEFVLAVLKNSKWDKPKIEINSLKNERFISMHPNSSLYKFTRKICNEAGFEPNIAIQSDDPFYLRKYVELGLGIAFVPSVSWNGLFDKNVVLKSVCNVKRDTYLFSNPDRYCSVAVGLFCDELEEICKSIK